MDSDSEWDPFSFLSQLLSPFNDDEESDFELAPDITELLTDMASEMQRDDSNDKELLELTSLITQLISLTYFEEPEWKFISLITQIISFVKSMDLKLRPKKRKNKKLMLLVMKIVSMFNSMDLDSQPKPLSNLISLVSRRIPHLNPETFISFLKQTLRLRPWPELISLINQIVFLERWEPETVLESDLISLISQLKSTDDGMESEIISLISQIASLASSMELCPQPRPQSKFRSLVTQTISVFNSMDLDSQPKPLRKLILSTTQLVNSMDSKLVSLFEKSWNLELESEIISSSNSTKIPHVSTESFISLFKQTLSLKLRPELMSLIHQIISLVGSLDTSSEPETVLESNLISLISQLSSTEEATRESEIILLISHIASLASAMELYPQPRPQSKFRSLISQTISVFNSMDLDSQPEPMSKLVSLVSQKLSLINSMDSEFKSLVGETRSLEPQPEFISLIHQTFSYVNSLNSEPDVLEFFSLIHQRETITLFMDRDLEPEWKLLSLISKLTCLVKNSADSKFISLIIQIISLVSSMDMESQPKPESEFMSLVTQAISIFNSMDLDSQPQPLLKLISLISKRLRLKNSTDLESEQKDESEFMSLVAEMRSLESESKLISLIHQIYSLVISINSASGMRDFLCAQLDVRLDGGKFNVTREDKWRPDSKWSCIPRNWEEFKLEEGGDATHFLCRSCNGQNHKFNKALVEIKHPLHPKHSLQLVLLDKDSKTRECYCCDKDLREVFYYCSACDYAMNIACVVKPPLLTITQPKWHEHTLAHFPRQASFTCDLCALVDPSCPIYICLPCDFVVHQSCISLPHVIRISRHPHRIAFIPFFDKGVWSCGVCRQKINNDYGGYSCIKSNCSYAVHSKCATQSNVWDGTELDGVPEEIEDEPLEPFVRISDGIIQHFSHAHHHLRLDPNTCKDYDVNKQCQSCITPIYFGKFYSCLTCDFILHEDCANLSRKIHHPIHPHPLTLGLVGGSNDVVKDENTCSACPGFCTAGFFYECSKEGCSFKLHVQCATISEPLVHESHDHPLFLTSKPGEPRRKCSVCKSSYSGSRTDETFNCIECDFALCFECATIPHLVRYKHDKHMLTLSYGEETSTTAYWCEVCEKELDPKERFYKCDEYCCVTLHIECLMGNDLYMKLGSSWLFEGKVAYVLPNNHMSRPPCSSCQIRCPHNIVFQCSGLEFCSSACMEIFFTFFSKREKIAS